MGRLPNTPFVVEFLQVLDRHGHCYHFLQAGDHLKEATNDFRLKTPKTANNASLSLVAGGHSVRSTVGNKAASFIPWMIFLSAGHNVASTPCKWARCAVSSTK